MPSLISILIFFLRPLVSFAKSLFAYKLLQCPPVIYLSWSGLYFHRGKGLGGWFRGSQYLAMASLSILFLKTASCFLRNKRATLEINGCIVCTFRIQKNWAQIFLQEDKKNRWPFQCPNSYHHDHLGNQCLTNSATPAMSLAKKKVLGKWTKSP